MTCKHCVGAESIFDQKEARKHLKRYQKKGPRKTSRTLIQGIISHMNGASSILDIGAGVGAVHLESMKNGVKMATDVDASTSYIEASKKASNKLGYESHITYIHGDFLDVKGDVGTHDIVALDKVICCYPDMKSLLSEAAGKSTQILALTYPISHPIAKLFMRMMNVMMWLKKNPFRVQHHLNADVRSHIQSLGFENVYRKMVFPWNVEVYRRTSKVS